MGRGHNPARPGASESSAWPVLSLQGRGRRSSFPFHGGVNLQTRRVRAEAKRGITQGHAADKLDERGGLQGRAVEEYSWGREDSL